MKKNKYLTFVALARAALATSCTSDDIAGQQQGQNQSKNQTVTLTASVDQEQTRVGMEKGENSTASFYWHKGDAILVQTVDNGSYSGVKFTTTTENGAITATFTGDVTGTVGDYAVFPYSANHNFTSATALTYNLPATYTYNKVESNIFSKDESYPSNNTNMPMVGKIADGKIGFKHIGGLAVIRIDQMPATKGTLTVTANQQLSGDFTIADLSATDAQITTTTGSVSDDNKKVTFNFEGAEDGKVGVFYLPLATGSYSGVKIAVTCGENTQTINYGNLYVERSSVTAIPLYTIDNKLTKFSKIDGNVYTLNGREFIDLGLDVLWAKTNVGADTETGYGDYYALSDIAKTCSKWCAPCRMPTQTEINALASSINRSWITNKDGSGTNGFEVTSEVEGYTGQSMFFPAAGFSRNDSGIQYRNTYGYYWSSTAGKVLYLVYDDNGKTNQFGSSSTYTATLKCFLRAVTEK